ncbi:hypothetical protein VP1G_11379 [Cytospora mali]|uniref:Uncharacterized protein n=1 Tax=Cytospora mali TaxID=578113 RepID=A0A194VDM4_CYTMA|nr:hypothetical protein VP1G_11379 [Valsa mali var. pyri (nom. inval.)]
MSILSCWGEVLNLAIDLLPFRIEVLPGHLAGLLLLEHLVHDRDNPVFKSAVVGVGHNQVTNAVQTFGAQVLPHGAEAPGGQVGVAQALDEVLLDAAGGGDDGGDVAVLDEVAQDAAQAGRDEVGGVAEEDGGPVARVRVAPGAHVVDDAHGLAHGRRLEAHRFIGGD